MYIYTHKHTCTYTYIFIYMYIHTYVYIYTYIYTYFCIYIYMYSYIHICIHNTCTHTTRTYITRINTGLIRWYNTITKQDTYIHSQKKSHTYSQTYKNTNILKKHTLLASIPGAFASTLTPSNKIHTYIPKFIYIHTYRRTLSHTHAQKRTLLASISSSFAAA